MTKSGTQFIDMKLKSLLEEMKIKQHSALVEHPKTSRQAKAANRVLLRGLKQRLEEAKVNWACELPHILYHMNPIQCSEKLIFVSHKVLKSLFGRD